MNGTNTFSSGKGALVYVYSDDNGPHVAGDAGFSKALNADGFPVSSDLNVSSYLNKSKSGLSLLGNPFITNLDWDLVTAVSNISNSVYVWDNSTSDWKTWNGTAGDLTDGLIGPFNGFFVETTGVSPSLTIPITAKVEGSSAFLSKEIAKEKPIGFSLKLSSLHGLSNQAWIQFSENGKAGKDVFDAYSLKPLSASYVQLGTVSGEGKMLDINRLSFDFTNLEIPVSIKSTVSGEFNFRLDVTNLPTDWIVTLLDTKTGTEYESDALISFSLENPIKKAVVSTENRPNIEIQSASETRFVLKVQRGTTTSMQENKPQQFELSQNYPNPFNPSTTIKFALLTASSVQIDVFDVTGKLVKSLMNENKNAGFHQVSFNASNLSSGMYFYRIQTNQGQITKKMMLIK